MAQSAVEYETSVTSGERLRAARNLYGYLLDTHWTGRAVAGPDPGIRFNARFGRFLKSYTRFVPWRDDLIYAQAQKYWIFSNWRMADLALADEQECRDRAVACARYLLDVQRPDGYWEYPNREWKGRIASVEGSYAAMGLLETYRRTGDQRLLDGARKWYRFAVERIGFRGDDGLAALNYFADRGASMVPNVSASALRTFALLAALSEEDGHLGPCEGMVRFLRRVQLPTGELPYAVISPDRRNPDDRVHFLCCQYNAFELLNLAEYYRLTNDKEIWPVLENLARFVASGVTAGGACRYDCRQDRPEVTYYGAAAAAALHKATALGLGDFGPVADRAYRRVLSRQRPDGGMTFYSTGNYRCLTDRRSYPRYLSMILYLLLSAGREDGDEH